MFKAVKTKISNYLSPIFEKKNGEQSCTVTSPITRRKRPLNQANDCFETPGKKVKAEPFSIRSPLKLFDGWNWGGIFNRVSKENYDFLNMTEREVSPSFPEQSVDLNMASRRILTATRKREPRVPLSQISNTTLLDLTNTNDDDNDDDIEITNISIDLTKPAKGSFLYSKERNNVEVTKVDLTDTKLKIKDKQSKIFVQLPTSNMIGPLSRKTSGSVLHQTVRLDEKTRYKTLLAHYTNIQLPEYSESISPGKSSNILTSDEDSVTTLSSSWFCKKHIDTKPAFVDLTDEDPTNHSRNKTPDTTRRKFFHELLSQSKSSQSFLQCNSSESSLFLPKDSALLSNTLDVIETQKRVDESRTKADINSLLNTDWIQKWRDTIDPINLERERRITEEEKRKEVVKRKQKEEYEELQKKIQETAKVSEFIELTNEMKSQIKRALGPGNSRDVFVEGFNAEITRADIATLRNSTWLNDEVVNFYFNLLKERSEKDKNLPNIHVFNTFFYPKIMKTGHVGVKRWTRKIDVFSYDLILVPIHLGMHWCLAVIDMKGKEIAYYDSLKGNNPQCIVGLKKYLNDESIDKKKTEFNFDGWIETMPKSIPEQMNGCDCGVFACKYAEYRSRNAKFTFTQSNMPYFRKRMIYEICNKKLL